MKNHGKNGNIKLQLSITKNRKLKTAEKIVCKYGGHILAVGDSEQT